MLQAPWFVTGKEMHPPSSSFEAENFSSSSSLKTPQNPPFFPSKTCLSQIILSPTELSFHQIHAGLQTFQLGLFLQTFSFTFVIEDELKR